MIRALLALALLAAPVATVAAPLTIRPGESWAFRLARGEPVAARQVAPDAAPAKGEVMVTVRSFLGTMLSAVNGTGRALTFRAELVGGPGGAARTCTLPASRDPVLEQWPGKPADAVRVSRFRTTTGGKC